MEDKNTFFKAINEFGKDFDALQSYFLSQGKKRSLPDNMIKNKEQIRHFYYRTWLKISKHLKFSEGLFPPLFKIIKIRKIVFFLLCLHDDADKINFYRGIKISHDGNTKFCYIFFHRSRKTIRKV